MWISQIRLESIRGFASQYSLELSQKINLFVGQNNAGKSTILNTILLLQKQNSLTFEDITLGKQQGRIEIWLNDIVSYAQKYGVINQQYNKVIRTFNKNGSSEASITGENGGSNFGFFPEIERQNVLYPYLSKRKVIIYDESVNLGATNSVTGNFQFLSAKIARLCNVNHPNSQEYQQACEEIIGFPIATVASGSGQKAAYIIESFTEIPLSAMGEGISNLLGLIVDLCIAEDKIFLIEEPENDIHPKALKALLALIEKKSTNNQFFISTHSNIVTKNLGSVESSKIFRIAMSFAKGNKLPISHVAEVENEPIARLQLLEELGYEPFDFGQWKAWLILEESSAEVIIREFLIPKFVPKLKNKLRTYSARSLSEVEPKFKDFNNLFVFIHLEEIYKNKAWVLVDSGENESKIISEMQEMYSQSGWDKENFLQLSEHDFEKYYPDRFQAQVNEILAITNKKQKMESKKKLVEEVKQWIKDFPDEAKQEFAISAKEVIDILKTINKKTE